jgi:hypothetical protein
MRAKNRTNPLNGSSGAAIESLLFSLSPLCLAILADRLTTCERRALAIENSSLQPTAKQHH